jgi:hypothetical protein
MAATEEHLVGLHLLAVQVLQPAGYSEVAAEVLAV